MRTLVFFILFYSTSHIAFGQQRWAIYNDSCYRQTKSYYDSCHQLTSNKVISPDQVSVDRTLINLINRVYNDQTYSLTKLKSETIPFENSAIRQNRATNGTNLEFDANADGNLYVSIKAVVDGDLLKAKKIYLATKTHVLCNSALMYVNSLDFLYLRSLMSEIDFPIALKPYQSNLEVTKSE